jgi:acetyl esterase/lipase
MGDFSKSALIFSLVILTTYFISGLSPKFRVPEGNYSVEVIKDQKYYTTPESKADEQKHELDIYRPLGLDKRPVLFFIHGGSWTISDKSHYRYIGYTFASKGITTVVINYRLTPEVMHPEHIKDVARAFHWVIQNISKFGGDPQKIFVGGHSAGAHLGALLALDQEYLASEGLSNIAILGVISLSGVFDLGEVVGFSSVFTGNREARKLASPIDHVAANEPPFLIIYAERELPSLGHQSEEMARRLRTNHDEVTLLKIRHTAHLKLVWDVGRHGDQATQSIIDFIESHSEPQ